MTRLGWNLLGIIGALALWEGLGRISGDANFAPFSAVVVEYFSMLQDGTMLTELGNSLREMLIGYGLACVVGMPVGILMGRSFVFDGLLHPWLSMMVVTSVAALVPLFVLLFGTGLWFRAMIVFTATVWYIILTVYHGARGVEPRFLEVGRAFNAGRSQTFFNILLPALYPYLFTAGRIGLLHAIRAMVVAEMFIIVGYGGLIHNAGLDISTAPLLGLLVTLMLLGILANVSLRAAGRLIAPWYEERFARVQSGFK